MEPLLGRKLLNVDGGRAHGPMIRPSACGGWNDYDFYVILQPPSWRLHMTDFEDLLHQIEEEAEAEGPAGRAHFDALRDRFDLVVQIIDRRRELHLTCLLYTSDAADEEDSVDLGGRRIIKKKKDK